MRRRTQAGGREGGGGGSGRGRGEVVRGNLKLYGEVEADLEGINGRAINMIKILKFSKNKMFI